MCIIENEKMIFALPISRAELVLGKQYISDVNSCVSPGRAIEN